MRNLAIGCLVIVLFVPYALFAQFRAGDQAYYVTGSSGRAYDVTTPTNYNPSKEYPVVFELHGMGFSRGYIHDNDSYESRQKVVDELQYISIRPEAEVAKVKFIFSKSLDIKVWNSWGITNQKPIVLPDDVDYIKTVYDQVRGIMGASFNPDKVYIYGFSNGGAMAMKMIQQTHLFKAATIHSMSLLKGKSPSVNMVKIPIMFIHGTADTYVPYYGGSPTNNDVPAILRPFIKFMPIKETVDLWAKNYNLNYKFEAEYEANDYFSRNFYYREYTHPTHPIYFFVSKDTYHVSDAGFDIDNVRRAFVRFFSNPSKFGIYKNVSS
ncbi:CE1 family esterase [Ornithobacterium rhinotracheale]|uniref:alpha/beta hydrolase family esterase n=1 Tax=Ornithobacterium rhinotracheale TaxID=28251 RepID=UPI001FF2AA1B|nr:dienelactone hydrolase family protein [Ornithobacterium rhinotracheale]MCK0204834.1 dienelactone hydrolase family protein [Ornithobacterium rhinotracheale]